MMRMTNRPAAKTFLIQASKYALVGLGNTLLTFVVYFLLTEIFALSPGLANPIGYAVGLVNSFVWNRRWTFGHSGAWIGSAVRFLAVFAVCLRFSMLCATTSTSVCHGLSTTIISSSP